MKRCLIRRAAAVLAAALLPLVAGVSAAPAHWERLRTGPVPQIGCEPPEFSLPTPEGRLMDIGTFREKVILLTFCSGHVDACSDLVRALSALLDAYGARGVVAPLVVSEMPLAVSRDECAGLRAMVGARFPTMIDDGRRLKGSYKVHQLPTTFVIGRDFCIRDRVRGEAVFYTPEFREALETLLGEKP